MGNSSAGYTFAVVADALLEEAVNGTRLIKILVPLINHLDGEDWDTQDESIDKYAEYPWVIEAFTRTGHTKDANEPDRSEPDPVPDAEPRPAGKARIASAGRGRPGGRSGQV